MLTNRVNLKKKMLDFGYIVILSLSHQMRDKRLSLDRRRPEVRMPETTFKITVWVSSGEKH